MQASKANTQSLFARFLTMHPLLKLLFSFHRIIHGIDFHVTPNILRKLVEVLYIWFGSFSKSTEGSQGHTNTNEKKEEEKHHRKYTVTLTALRRHHQGTQRSHAIFSCSPALRHHTLVFSFFQCFNMTPLNHRSRPVANI